MPGPRGSVRHNVWPHVDKTSTPNGCWPWTGQLDEHGRIPRVRIDARRTTVARAIIEDAAGARLRPSVRISRTCGDIACCRPEHLTAVTS